MALFLSVTFVLTMVILTVIIEYLLGLTVELLKHNSHHPQTEGGLYE